MTNVKIINEGYQKDISSFTSENKAADAKRQGLKKQNDELKKKISSVKDQIKLKDEASVELLSIIDLLHDLNGMENAGEDLLQLL